MAEYSTLARPYSKAAFACAEKAGVIEQWSEHLAVLAEALQSEGFAAALKNPVYSLQHKVTLLQQLFDEPVDELFQSFLQLLADNRRLMLLEEIYQQFMQMRAQKLTTSHVAIRTAKKLTQKQITQLSQQLADTLGGAVELEWEQDDSLLSGAVMRIGDTVVDGSLRGRLAQLGSALAN